MKKVFYKNYLSKFMSILGFLLGFLILVFLVYYSVSYGTKSFDPVFVFSVALFVTFLPIIATFFSKQLFSKIIFTEQGIEWKHLKKQILFFKWEEITSVQEKAKSMAIIHLIIYRNDEKIVIEVSKKMYNTIDALCPIPTLKLSIQNLKSYKLFKKSRNNSRNNNSTE